MTRDVTSLVVTRDVTSLVVTRHVTSLVVTRDVTSLPRSVRDSPRGPGERLVIQDVTAS